jgi:hypothetical protein
MITIKKGKRIGFYFLLLAGIFAIASFARYMLWAPANDALNSIILLSLILGFALNILLVFYDNDYLLIVLTVLYSISFFQLIVDSIGSFVDAYQGIVMFGDPTQVGTIVSINILIAISILTSIAAGFTTRVKEIEK